MKGRGGCEGYSSWSICFLSNIHLYLPSLPSPPSLTPSLHQELLAFLLDGLHEDLNRYGFHKQYVLELYASMYVSIVSLPFPLLPSPPLPSPPSPPLPSLPLLGRVQNKVYKELRDSDGRPDQEVADEVRGSGEEAALSGALLAKCAVCHLESSVLRPSCNCHCCVLCIALFACLFVCCFTLFVYLFVANFVSGMELPLGT